jgi:hypothetical protein
MSVPIDGTEAVPIEYADVAKNLSRDSVLHINTGSRVSLSLTVSLSLSRCLSLSRSLSLWSHGLSLSLWSLSLCLSRSLASRTHFTYPDCRHTLLRIYLPPRAAFRTAFSRSSIQRRPLFVHPPLPAPLGLLSRPSAH